MSKPPVGLRVPVPSTGSGTWAGDCGFRSLRQAQGPGSGTAGSGPWAGCGRWLSLSKPPGDCGFRSRVREVAEPVEATGGTAGSGPFDRLRDLGSGTAGSGPFDRLRDLGGVREVAELVEATGGSAGSAPFDRLRDLGRRLRVSVPSTGSETWVGDCGFRSLRRAQGPGWGPGGAGSRRPPQEILALSNLSGIVWRAAVPPAEATPTEEDSMDQIDAPVAPVAASSVAARPGRRS